MRVDKRRLTTAVAKHVLNPIVTIGVDTGLLRGWAIIETTGRKSGMPRRTAVGNGLQGDTFWIVAERLTVDDAHPPMTVCRSQRTVKTPRIPIAACPGTVQR